MTGTPPAPWLSRLSVGTFNEADRLESALAELARFADFVVSECSLLARRHAVETAFRARLKPLAQSDDGARRYLVTGVSARAHPTLRRNLLRTFIEIDGPEPVLASPGPLAEIIARRGRDTAASSPALLAPLLPAGDAARLQSQLDGGLLLLWIPVRDSDEELRTCRTLLKYSDRAVSTHDIRAPKTRQAPG